MTVRGCTGRNLDQGGGGGGVGTEGEPDLCVLGAKANPQPELWMMPKANQPSLVLVVGGVELAPKVNQSSTSWVPKVNPQRELWVVPKANQPSLVLEVERVELAQMVNQNSLHQGKEVEKNSHHQAAESQCCPLESPPFSSFLPWSPQGR